MDRATQYATDVVNGKVPYVGKLHYLACERHLKDLQRQGTEGFPYFWNPEKAETVLTYAETLTIAEGSKPQPVKLFGFQCFDIGVPFGWYKDNGYRRFRTTYKSVARQNGKTFENGIKGSYIAGFGGYNYGKLFTVATKHAQAKLAWDEVAKFIRIDPDLSECFQIQEYKSLITALGTNCTIEALSKERSLDDGFRGIYISIDEIHQHKDNQIYNTMKRGTRALKETMISMITTRGFDLNSFCFEFDEMCVNILIGSFTDETIFVDIYAPDKEDDIWLPENQYKANPLLCQTQEGRDILAADARLAKEMGGFELRDFMTKCLNTWVQQSDNQYMSPEVWKKCGTNKTLENMRGERCYVGLDLSSGGDLTSLALEFPQDNGKFYIYSHSFMPRMRLNEHIKSDLAPYDIWENDGLLTVTETFGGVKNDYKFIVSHLKNLIEKYDIEIVGIAYDTHNADGFLGDLEQFGVPLVAITQSARFLNDATIDFELECKAGNVEYDKSNDLMTWSMINAKLVKNSFGEVKVDKEVRSRCARIDVVDAIIDAHTLCMKSVEKGVNVEEEMDKYLKMMGWG